MPDTIQTDRLILRPWRLSDLERLFEISSDRDVMRFVGDGSPWTRDRCREFMNRNERQLAETGFCQWAIEVRDTSELIGFCGFVRGDSGVEIGWRIDGAFQRRGFGFEAARAVVNSGDASGQTIVATIQAENLPSQALASRLGMGPVETLWQDGRELCLYWLDSSE